MSPLAVINRAELQRLLDAARAGSDALAEQGCDEAAVGLHEAAAAIRVEAVELRDLPRLSETRNESEWIAARVHELWQDPAKVCDALERFVTHGCTVQSRYPADMERAHRAARYLREGKGAALVLLLQQHVQSRLTDVARDEWDELDEPELSTPRSSASPFAPPCGPSASAASLPVPTGGAATGRGAAGGGAYSNAA